jgi:hypothetical protein
MFICDNNALPPIRLAKEFCKIFSLRVAIHLLVFIVPSIEGTGPKAEGIVDQRATKRLILVHRFIQRR